MSPLRGLTMFLKSFLQILHPFGVIPLAPLPLCLIELAGCTLYLKGGLRGVMEQMGEVKMKIGSLTIAKAGTKAEKLLFPPLRGGLGWGVSLSYYFH